jgi:hypothetical protein
VVSKWFRSGIEVVLKGFGSGFGGDVVLKWKWFQSGFACFGFEMISKWF